MHSIELNLNQYTCHVKTHMTFQKITLANHKNQGIN